MNCGPCRVVVENGTVSIVNKRRRNDTYLSFCQRVTYAQKKLSPISSCLNHIRVPQSVRERISGAYCTLVNPTNGFFMDVIIDPELSTEKPDEIQITAFLERALGATPGSELVLCNQDYCTFGHVKAQKLSNVKSDILVVPEDPKMEALLRQFSLFEIIDLLTGDSIFVRSKYVSVDPGLKNGEIRINKKQRTMLGDHIPPRLSSRDWDKIMDSDGVTDETKTLLREEYTKDGSGYTVSRSVNDMPYTVRGELQSFTRAWFGERMIVRPVPDSFYFEKKKGIVKTLSDFFVGKSTLSLNCRRPHECDENADIVRMTEDNMLFLGIEAMDKVIIQYKENRTSCHVLPFDPEKFQCTNIPTVMEFSIGIPAHIRDKLGIVDIQSAVKVDRDTAFLFRKSFNEQLVPMLLALVSLSFFEQTRWYVATAIIAVLLIIIMYITLSPKRNARGK